jgi:hypothetical protein
MAGIEEEARFLRGCVVTSEDILVRAFLAILVC